METLAICPKNVTLVGQNQTRLLSRRTHLESRAGALPRGATCFPTASKPYQKPISNHMDVLEENFTRPRQSRRTQLAHKVRSLHWEILLLSGRIH
jgi:hypothetical protein